MENSLHPSQLSTLYALRHARSARFGRLMRDADMTSDVYKFHLRSLVASGHVVKLIDGSYGLTAKGKEFANRLDDNSRRVQRQPKTSMLVIARHPDDAARFICQRRLRNPYYGFYGCISGPVLFGEDIEVAAKQELFKQTGVRPTQCMTRSFLRQRDYDDSAALLEDKLFAVVEAVSDVAELRNDWPGGQNCWMTREQFERLDHRFDSTLHALDMLRRGSGYYKCDIVQEATNY